MSQSDWVGFSRKAVAPAIPAFVRWQQEAEKHHRAGDYAWMADQLSPCRVLEVGCGTGYGTLALCRAGCSVKVLEPSGDCIAVAEARLRESEFGGDTVSFSRVGVGDVDAVLHGELQSFAPEVVVCWLMGADDSALDSGLPPAQAVQKHREFVHRQAAELASKLPSVQMIHLVDRSAFPWKIKETARETLVAYHCATTLHHLPFEISIPDTLYRKLDERQWPVPAGGRQPVGLVPVLGSMLARHISG